MPSRSTSGPLGEGSNLSQTVLLDLEFGKSDTMQDFGKRWSHSTVVSEESDASEVTGCMSQYAFHESFRTHRGHWFPTSGCVCSKRAAADDMPLHRSAADPAHLCLHRQQLEC